MKKSIKLIIVFILGGIFFTTAFSYAITYNSEEILYDNTKSGAEAENVKDAIDYLYSHGSCGEGMSCLESPIVTITVNGPGSVNKTTLSVPINGSSILEVTPNEGYVLQKVECNGGYEVGTYKEYSNSGAESKQNIEISNTRLFDNGTCTVTFGTNEINVISSTNPDQCNNGEEGCICWYIKNGGSNFTYGQHTGCNFKSQSCIYCKDNTTFNCSRLGFGRSGSTFDRWYDPQSSGLDRAICSGVITCET